MHVCFFSQYSSTNNAGASLSMFNIANELVHRGVKVTIILASYRNIETLHIDSRIKLIHVPFYGMRMTLKNLNRVSYPKFYYKYLYNKLVVKKIITILRHDEPSAIHINGLDNPIGAEIALKMKIPYVWHIRQFLEEDFGQRLFKEKYLFSLVKKANTVIAISKDVRRVFMPKIKRDIQVIYNGVPIGNYQISNHQILVSDKVRMLLPGRISVQKGQMDAIKAIEILRDQGKKNVSLTIVGQEETKGYLKTVEDYISDHHLKDAVSLHKQVADLSELRKQHDIGLTCSQREAFGRVTVENMMSGMLAIGANSGGTPEIITDGVNGLLYPVNDVEKLASILENAIENVDSTRKIAKRGYSDSLKKFSITHVVDQLEALYATVG